MDFGISTANAKKIYDKRDLIREYTDLGLTFRERMTKKEAEKFRHLRSTLSDKEYKNELMKTKKKQRQKAFERLKYLKRQLNEKGEDLSDKQKEKLSISENRKLKKDEEITKRGKKVWRCEISLVEFPTIPGNIDVTVRPESRQFTVDGLSMKQGTTETGFKFRSETRWRKSFDVPDNVDVDRGPRIRKKEGDANTLIVTFDLEKNYDEDDEEEMITLVEVPEISTMETEEQCDMEKEPQSSEKEKKKSEKRCDRITKEMFPIIKVPELSSSEDESKVEDKEEGFFIQNNTSKTV